LHPFGGGKKEPLAGEIVSFRIQNDFFRECNAFLNNGYLSRSSYSQVLHRLLKVYPRLRSLPSGNAHTVDLVIPPYRGSIDEANDICGQISNIHTMVLGVFIHGSVALDMVVPFSDLDCLVILKHEAFAGPDTLDAVGKALRAARRKMNHFDPLQHHGWIILSEADMPRYCNAYFPIEGYSDMRSIQGADPVSLSVKVRESGMEMRKAFIDMSRNLQTMANGAGSWYNAYKLKSFLSGLMLVPSLYYQAVKGRGIPKRLSFEVIRPEFSPSLWEPIIHASRIRSEWRYRLFPGTRTIMGADLRLRHILLRSGVVRSHREIANLINERFLRKSCELLIEMEYRIR
jgi:hypothetical protein